MARITKSMAAAVGMIVATMSNSAWAQGTSVPEGYLYGHHMMWPGGGWFGMIFGSLFMILALALVIALAIFLVRWLGGLSNGTGTHQLPRNRTPVDILKERYARGEIDKEEFEERRRILED